MHEYPTQNDCPTYTTTTTDIPTSTIDVSSYEITIQKLNHGYILKVGCQTFALESYKKVLTILEAYFIDPTTTVNNWLEHKILP